MKEAIQKAMERGYRHPDSVNYLDAELALTYSDPLFWQCLGKSLGWKEIGLSMSSGGRALDVHEWMMYWHNFIDHLIEGKDADSFFTTLLNK